MSYVKNIENQKFGKLTALEIVGKQNRVSVWKCLCECGKYTNVKLGNLRTGNTKTCGKCKHE